MSFNKNDFMKAHKTIFDKDVEISDADKQFNYQSELTSKLDNINSPLDQEIINEIVLWKVNRYAKIDNYTLNLLNEIDDRATEINTEKTRIILKALLREKGIQLPMASTILRFKNKNIYQIIDQRVFRIIYEKQKLKIKTYPNEENLNEQINLYFRYLRDLKAVCDKFKIPFDKSDRILFMVDKRINKDVPLDNYSKKTKEK